MLENLLSEKWAFACLMFPSLQRINKPKIVFNARLKTTCARVFVESGVIEINKKMFFLFPAEFEKDIIGHEIGHIIDSHFNPKKYSCHSDKLHHTESWYSILNFLGWKAEQYSPSWMLQ
jgi:predicted SprT family Zn-dependent metalloprotease